jgi:hypothetical protein
MEISCSPFVESRYGAAGGYATRRRLIGSLRNRADMGRSGNGPGAVLVGDAHDATNTKGNQRSVGAKNANTTAGCLDVLARSTRD